jgi:hypothetical protein
MTNAQAEFVRHIEDKASVIAADIRVEYLHSFVSTDITRIFLRLDFTEWQFAEFLRQLNFEYDSGYGTQHVHGFIWYSDGTWSSRHEYDGSEYWQHNTVPLIPNE